MAQPAQLVIQYLGAFRVHKNKTYTTADILTDYPTATVLILKSRPVADTPIKVSIDGTDAFEITFDDASYIATGLSYIFTQDCTIAVGKYIASV